VVPSGVDAKALGCLVALAVLASPRAAPARGQRPDQPHDSPAVASPRVGFTLHWDFFASGAEADRLLAFALDHGAEILNVVPPPHIWEQPDSLAILRRIFRQAAARGVEIVINRIDGSSLSDASGQRPNWLYANVLTERGRLPSGRPTPDFFLGTVGKPDYERWLREETAFYAENFSSEPALVAFGVGLFNEPFVSQRGSLLCFDPGTNSYEVAQYTPAMAGLWRRWLETGFGGTAAVNARYGTRFDSIAEVPMPAGEADPAFGDAWAAYTDFVAAINEWVVRQLDDCRKLWHERARRAVPFMLQFSGYLPEKLEKGRPAFAALDVSDWMTRADALGLSVYTDCGYPDRGRASVRAMVSYLRLGPLLGKPVYVLEGGSECHGAVLDRDELRFFATAAGALAPASVIYEFLKVGYADRAATSAGKVIGRDWKARPRALAEVIRAFGEAKGSRAEGPTVLVLDDVAGLAADRELGRARLLLAREAMRRSLTFVPPGALPRLPPGSTVVAPTPALLAAYRERLRALGLTGVGLEALTSPPPR
jgi:hypothetical protein